MHFKTLSISLLALMGAGAAYGQDSLQAYARVNLTSAYLWRGYKVAGPSIQPEVGLRWKGFNLMAWGNEEFSSPKGVDAPHEIDLFLTYQPIQQLTVGFTNIYVSNRGNRFLSYGSIPHAANELDATLKLDLKYVNVDWSTTIAGYDGYNHDHKRAYGSYMVVSAPFSLPGFNCSANIGIVPYYNSIYDRDQSRGFHVNMCSLRAFHNFYFADGNMDITPYTQLMVNPSSRDAFFQVGVSFGYEPQ